MHVSTRKPPIKVEIDMCINGEDERMEEQIDFYEAVTTMTEKRYV